MTPDATGGSRPSIGVIMAARDASDTIAASVRSMLDQTVRPDQFVVVDDGSDDDTAVAVLELADAHEGLEVVRTAHVGRAAARNLAVARLSTDLVAVQDADDLALPWRLEEALATFEQHPDAHAVGAQMLAFRRPGYAWELPRWPVAPADIARTFADGVMAVAHPTTVMRRDAVLAAGGYDESFAYGEDLTLLAKLSAAGPIASSSRDVTLYRMPRRHSLRHVFRTDLARRHATALRLGAGDASATGPSLGTRLAALATAERVWVRQRVKPLPPERPLAEFGIDPKYGASA